MKKVISISLSVLILSLTTKDLMTYAHFFINQDFISNNLCINRDKPEIMCHGKCFLKKQIQENQKQEKKIPNPVKDKSSEIVFVSETKVLIVNDLYNLKKKKKIGYCAGSYSFSYHNEIFHPPQNQIG